MTFWAKIGWAFLGLLVTAAVGSMFFIDWLLGLIFALFCAGIFWFVYGVLKKKVDAQVSQMAQFTGLAYQPHPFAYASLDGFYKDLKAKVYYKGTSTVGMGLGLSVITKSPGWAALDIRNVTVIKMWHDLTLPREKIIEHGPPHIVAKKNEISLMLPGICTDKEEITKALDRLTRETNALQHSTILSTD